MHAITTTDLTKFYGGGKIKALQSLTLQVEQGKIFSLLGPNGAGKTTLIKLLLGIVFPTNGTATLLGKNINDYRSHHPIGYLSENHKFPEFLSANQILYYYGKMNGVSKGDLQKKIPQLLQQVRLEDWGDSKIRKYSKGMLQRLGIAQALINDPQLIFLDEPTDGIDPVGRREIRDLLSELRDQGKTIFLNSHLLSEVERVSDEVAILKKGRMVQHGTVEELISVNEQFQFQIRSGGEMLQSICRELQLSLVSAAPQFTVTVEDHQQLNRVIDLLREENIIIEGIVPKKISLEDFFIDVIADSPEVTA